jgi:O-antigen/teichoic acid export membrane protein
MSGAVYEEDLGLRRAGAHAFLFNGLMLVANLATGIMVARELGSHGRGAFTAVSTILVVGIWLFSLGSTPAASYYVARHPRQAPSFMGTWLALVLGMSLVAIAILELAVPTLLGAQSEHTQELARLYLPALVVALLYQLAFGVLLGAHDFFFVYLIGFLRPTAIAVAFGVLIVVDTLSVGSAILATALVDGVVCAVTLGRAVKKHGIARPSFELAKSTAWYGVRAQGTHVGSIINGRLDLFIMPAFLGSASVGLYSVATNVSWIVFTLASALATLVLPAAARRTESGTRIVVLSLYATLAVGVALAGAIALLADAAIQLIYGSEFDRSALPLRLLLPGSVAFALAEILISGLNSLGRPGAAAAAQAPGVLVTIVGLLLFLERGGIVAAAIVSSVAYAIVFVTALFLYRAAAGVPWRTLILRSEDIRVQLRQLATGRIRGPRPSERQEL